MKQLGSLVKKEREDIFRLFLDNHKLRFNEIEKHIKIRSNMVSYHLEMMQKEKIIEKKGEYYSLTKEAEKYLPIFSHFSGTDMCPLPIVLVALMKEDKILLVKRSKRPYKDYWSMIGGKMLLHETFCEASLRLVKKKSNIDGEFKSMNHVLHERVEGENVIKHSFILFFVKVEANQEEFRKSEYGELKWFNLKELDKEKVIPSDYWLIKNKLNSEIDVKSAHMNENEGELVSFEIV